MSGADLRPGDLLGAIESLLRSISYDDPGIVAIGTERARVLHEEGYDLDHDADEHTHGELVDAAICYLLGHGQDRRQPASLQVPSRWPWDAEDFKPGSTGNADTDRLRDLTRAGQLIAAEITRLTSSTGRLPLGARSAHA